jgi:hypothetical protein
VRAQRQIKPPLRAPLTFEEKLSAFRFFFAAQPSDHCVPAF